MRLNFVFERRDRVGLLSNHMEVKRVSQGVTTSTKIRLSSDLSVFEAENLPHPQKLNKAQMEQLLNAEMKVFAHMIKHKLRRIKELEQFHLWDARNKLCNTDLHERGESLEDRKEKKEWIDREIKILEGFVKEEHEVFTFLKFLLKKVCWV